MTPDARHLLRNSINLNMFRSIDSRSARCHHGDMTRKPGRQPGTAADRRMPNGHLFIPPAINYLPHSAPAKKAIAK